MTGAGRVAQVYERLGSAYDRFSAVLDRTAVNRMRSELLARATGDVLEVAVGTGVNLRRYPAGVRVVGVDVAGAALAAAGAKATGIDWTPVRGDAETLPVASGSVDTVVCTLAGCTFARPEVAFAEMRRVLRPGGHALFLEHVRAPNRYGAAALRAITPVTVAALGCHPDRDTLASITAAGFTPTVLERAVAGLFLAIDAVPA